MPTGEEQMMRSKMRTITILLLATLAGTLMGGCGAVPGELYGNRKPTPEFKGLLFNRESSTVTFYVNRGEFSVAKFEVYRVDQASGDRRYLNFTFERFSAQGTNGVAIYTMSHADGQATDYASVYYVGIQINAPVFATGGGLTTASAAAMFRCDPSGAIARVSRQEEEKWAKEPKRPAAATKS